MQPTKALPVSLVNGDLQNTHLGNNLCFPFPFPSLSIFSPSVFLGPFHPIPFFKFSKVWGTL